MEEAVKGCKKGTRLEDCNKDLGYAANDVVTETELTKIRHVRAFVETQDPSSKVLPNLFIHNLRLFSYKFLYHMVMVWYSPHLYFTCIVTCFIHTHKLKLIKNTKPSCPTEK
jgi:hypothetical protein